MATAEIPREELLKNLGGKEFWRIRKKAVIPRRRESRDFSGVEKIVTLSFFEEKDIGRAKGFQGLGPRSARLESGGADFSGGRAASFGGYRRGSSGLRGNPADASGGFRPDPQAQMEAFPPFFQNSKVLQKVEFPPFREGQINFRQYHQMKNAGFGKFRIGSEKLFPSPHGIFQMRRENGQFFGSQFEKEIQIPIGLQDF